MTVVQIAGIATIVIGQFWSTGAHVLGHLCAIAATWLVESARAVDAAPWLAWRAPPAPLPWVLAFYASLAVAIGMRGWSWSRSSSVAVAAVSLIVIAFSPGLSSRQPP